MAQFARPDSNVTQTAFTGGFAEIDEATASDADLAWSTDGSDATLEVGLSNVSDPSSGSGHTFRYRAAKTNDGVLDGAGNAKTVTASLYQGGTLIASDVERTLTGSWQDFSFTLSSGQADTITDYTDLRLRFVTLGGGGNPTNRRGIGISWAELEVPDAAAGTNHTKDLADSITLTDAIAKNVTKPSADSVAFTDSAAKSSTISKADAVTFADEINTDLVVTLELSDSVSFTDAVQKDVSLSRGDNVSFADETSKSAAVVKADAVNFDDEATPIVTLLLELSDSVSFTDSVSKTFTASIDDDVSFQDATWKAVSITAADNVTFVDEATPIITLLLDLADAVTFTDSVTRSIGKNIADDLLLSDQIAKSASKGFTDDVQFQDQSSAAIIVSLDLADGINFTDELVRNPGKGISDLVVLSDSLSKAQGKALTDSVSFVDAAGKTAGKNVSDVIAFNDSLTSDLVLTLNLADSLTFADSFSGFTGEAAEIYSVSAGSKITLALSRSEANINLSGISEIASTKTYNSTIQL